MVKTYLVGKVLVAVLHNKTQDCKVPILLYIDGLVDSEMVRTVFCLFCRVFFFLLDSFDMFVCFLKVFSSSHDSKLRMYSMEEMHLTRSVALGNEHHDNGGINISCCFPMPNNKTVLVGEFHFI